MSQMHDQFDKLKSLENALSANNENGLREMKPSAIKKTIVMKTRLALTSFSDKNLERVNPLASFMSSDAWFTRKFGEGFGFMLNIFWCIIQYLATPVLIFQLPLTSLFGLLYGNIGAALLTILLCYLGRAVEILTSKIFLRRSKTVVSFQKKLVMMYASLRELDTIYALPTTEYEHLYEINNLRINLEEKINTTVHDYVSHLTHQMCYQNISSDTIDSAIAHAHFTLAKS